MIVLVLAPLWMGLLSWVPGCLACDRSDGTCFHQCQGRSVVLSSSSSPLPLSSSLGWHRAVGEYGVQSGVGLSHCLWVLSVSQDLVPCAPGQSCPPMALTLHPDSHTQCSNSFVYVFDGLPRILGNGVVHSDHNLIGAFCGTTRTQPITVEATSGIISVYFEANVSSTQSQGFNASFWVRRCEEGASGKEEAADDASSCPAGSLH
ncbi:multiple epidermal growth factor-like domains protein 8 [Sardina pilchardus]|uniref:multiple epidermal growth factor-like domains protein 8 n=1 Tax=Sardina pilchardus TaxID=27697 RepID=UPI002E0EE343